jgi:hypothetical protein
MNTSVRLGRRTASPQEKPFGPRWLRIAFWFCTAIAVAAVLRRLFALAHPPQSGPPQLVAVEADFASHAALTLAHILPALAFVLLAPLVFMRQFADAPWVDRVLYPLGVIVGITAYAMSGHPVGGWVERWAVLLFNTLVLFSLARSFLFWRRGEALLKVRWLIRAIGILLGIATTVQSWGRSLPPVALLISSRDSSSALHFGSDFRSTQWQWSSGYARARGSHRSQARSPWRA